MAPLEELPLELPAPAAGMEPMAQAVAVDPEIPFVLLGLAQNFDVFCHGATVRAIIGGSIAFAPIGRPGAAIWRGGINAALGPVIVAFTLVLH
jgi:hypothetical protein